MSGQIENTAEELIAKLTATLPDKIAEINSDYDDDWVLDPPTAITFGVRAEMQFPHISILPVRSPVSHDGGELVIYNHEIRVAVWIAHFAEEGLTRMLIRYQRAIRECLLEHRHPNLAAEAGPGGYGLQLTEDEYGSPFQDQEIAPGLFIAIAASSYRVQQQEIIQ